MYPPLKKRHRPRSVRERLESSHLAQSFYASASDKVVAVPDQLQALRERAARRAKNAKPKAPQPSEHQEQCAVIAWWWAQHNYFGLPHFALFAVPNGGARDAITGARLKAEGVRPGALDLILAKPSRQYHGLLLEMKVGKNQPTPEQEHFIDYLRAQGYKATVHWSAASAIAEIREYLADM